MGIPNLTAATVAKIRELAAAGKTPNAIGRELSISPHTAKKYANPNPNTPQPSGRPAEASPPVDPVAEAQRRRESARELAREREQLTAVAGERSFRAYLESLLRDAIPTIDAPPAYREPKTKAATVEESLLLLLSDWHAYEVVKPERTLGLNEYTAEVLGRRAWRVIDGVRSIATKLRAGGWKFPRLVVAANGDMISGTIHEVERHSDAPNVIQAAIGCGLLLAQALRDLAATFEVVDVFGTSGNHGRLPDHRKVSQKDPSRSWDYLIYAVAKIALQDVKNVRFTLPDSYTVTYDVEGWRVYQGHGHDIKSWQSIPFYGISRTATGLQAIRASANQPIHYFLFSHFHNAGSICAPGSEYFVNGSLIGGTEYSVNGLGRADRPSQWLLAFHKDHGITHRWAMYADGPGREGTYKVKPWESAA